MATGSAFEVVMGRNQPKFGPLNWNTLGLQRLIIEAIVAPIPAIYDTKEVQIIK